MEKNTWRMADFRAFTCLAFSGALLFTGGGCSYPPYPDGEPKTYAECIEKNTRNFTSADAERAMILTRKACQEKFPQK